MITDAETRHGSDHSAETVDRRAWKVLAVAAAGVFVVFLDATVVNIAFPAITKDFPGANRADLSWVLNAYAVVFGALLVTSGQLADQRGRKRIFLIGLVGFGLASALCGMAPSVGLLIAARAVQAIGAALLVPSSLALLLPEFPASRRASAVGIWGAAGALAAATGPTLGALLIDGPGWRWVFYLNVPFCLVAFLFARRILRESTAPHVTGRPDLVGVAVVTVAFGALSLGIVEGQDWGWTSARVIGAFLLGAALIPVLVVRGLSHARPALPIRLFRVPMFSYANLGTLLFSAAFFANILCNVLFMTSVWHYSILRTAIAVMPAPVMATLTAPIAGRLAERFGFRAVIVPGSLSMAVGTIWFATQTGVQAHYFADFFLGSICTGLAVGFGYATLGAAGAQALPPEEFAIGSAVIATARQLGAVLGIAVLVAVLGQPTSATALHAFHRSWLVIASIAIASTISSFGLVNRRG